MFGLMRACSCNKTEEQRELQRLHYCGTCKTIGRMYGQKSRMLLNYDAVFLGEVLTALQPQQPQFAPAYVSKSCFAIPRSEQMPWPLQYAATTNVILVQLKLLDHIADTGSRFIKVANRMYSKEFRQATRVLTSFHFPLKELHHLMSLQIEREREANPTIDRLSEPTAGATRLVFEHGAEKACSDPETKATMARLGYVFGEIAYLVDAIQDREQDAKKGVFNALAATGTDSDEAIRLLRAKQQEMLGFLRALPVEEERKKIFDARLRTNLAPILLSGTMLNSMRTGRTRTTSRRGPAPDPNYGPGPAGPGCICGCCDCCDCACCACECASCCDCLGGCMPC